MLEGLLVAVLASTLGVLVQPWLPQRWPGPWRRNSCRRGAAGRAASADVSCCCCGGHRGRG